MTSTWRSREELAHQVALLAKQGDSRRAISRALGISRNTVRTLLAAHAHDRETEHVAIAPRPTRAPRASKIDAWGPRVAELMAKYHDITAQRVFETLRGEGFDGG
jgi:transposase